MTYGTNLLAKVETLNQDSIALLLNEFCLINLSNKKFKNFQDEIANLGQSISFELPPKGISSDGLIANWKGVQQRYQTLTVSQSRNYAVSFPAEQLIYNNIDNLREKIAKTAMAEIGTVVEQYMFNVVKNNTYRFYGDGVTPINSYGQLGEMLKYFGNYGAVRTDLIGILPDIQTSAIINSGLNQFATIRNNEIADSWVLGAFGGCKWYQSNLTPEHESGLVGNYTDNTLTVVSTDDPTGTNITTLYCTVNAGLSGQTGLLNNNDLASFTSNTLKYLTFHGHAKSQCAVQVRVVSSTPTGGVNVTVNISPSLCSVESPNQNISRNIIAGDKLAVVPSHRCGVLMSGNPCYLAMPRMPNNDPYKTSNMMDPDSGVSLRLTHGAIIGQDVNGFIYDLIYDGITIPEQTMRVVFPLN